MNFFENDSLRKKNVSYNFYLFFAKKIIISAVVQCLILHPVNSYCSSCVSKKIFKFNFLENGGSHETNSFFISGLVLYHSLGDIHYLSQSFASTENKSPKANLLKRSCLDPAVSFIFQPRHAQQRVQWFHVHGAALYESQEMPLPIPFSPRKWIEWGQVAGSLSVLLSPRITALLCLYTFSIRPATTSLTTTIVLCRNHNRSGFFVES